MIKSMKFKVDWRCFKAGETFLFRPGVNLLVGDQGTGKSSLLTLFRWGLENNKEANRIVSVCADKSEFFMFDFEQDNPRTHHFIEFTTDALMRYVSHGNCVLALLNVLGKKCDAKKSFIMDEPDMALSVRSILKLVGILQATQHQVIAAVHNPFLIRAFPKVLSLEHKKWMLSKEFLDSQTS